MNERRKLLRLIFIFNFITTACAISFMGNPLSEAEQLQTAVAETITANLSQIQQEEDQQAEPTITLNPTATQNLPPTETPKPCNVAQFISETVPDGTELATGQSFDKTWRIKNIGTCTWNSDYALVFASGAKMNGASSVSLGQLVNPGETVDVGVTLKVPDEEGTYRGYWKVQDDQGDYFVNNIWVEIKAVSTINPILLFPLIEVQPLLALKPDLVITSLEITPSTPTMGAITTARVKIKNAGTLDSGGFTVQWFGLDTFSNPSCSWTVSGGLVKDGSVTLECNFVFASWYPVNKTTIAYVDTGNTVNESNESNNSFAKSPFGVNQ
jgi:hypothetical protein